MTLRKTSPLLPLFLLALAAFAPGRAAAEESRPTEIYRRVLRSTALVVNPGDNATGTAWVVDRAHRLLVTNQHVVGKQEEVFVLFPAFRDGEVVAERSF